MCVKQYPKPYQVEKDSKFCLWYLKRSGQKSQHCQQIMLKQN